MRKLKIVVLSFVILVLFLFSACSSGNNADVAENQKEDYNIAYISFHIYGEFPGNLDEMNQHLGSTYHSTSATYYHISDWKYGKNETIILYFPDGRVLQTSTNNVVLMKDPNIHYEQ